MNQKLSTIQPAPALPGTQKCERCDGIGIVVWVNNLTLCPDCTGKGRIPEPEGPR